jgi:hypothetical protein
MKINDGVGHTLISYKGFVQFLHSQPGDREINHHSYATCAVADYCESLGFDRFEGHYASEILRKECPPEVVYFNAFGKRDTPEWGTYKPMQDHHPLLE